MAPTKLDENDDFITYLLNKDLAESTIDLCAQVFTVHEPLAAGKVSFDDFRIFCSSLVYACIDDELSTVTCDKKNGTPVNFHIASDATTQFPAIQVADHLSKINAVLDAVSYNYQKTIGGVDKGTVVHSLMGGTNIDYQNRAINKWSWETFFRNAKDKGYSVVYAQTTGPISKHIFIKYWNATVVNSLKVSEFDPAAFGHLKTGELCLCVMDIM
jgi:hypothetical protein